MSDVVSRVDNILRRIEKIRGTGLWEEFIQAYNLRSELFREELLLSGEHTSNGALYLASYEQYHGRANPQTRANVACWNSTPQDLVKSPTPLSVLLEETFLTGKSPLCKDYWGQEAHPFKILEKGETILIRANLARPLCWSKRGRWLKNSITDFSRLAPSLDVSDKTLLFIDQFHVDTQGIYECRDTKGCEKRIRALTRRLKRNGAKCVICNPLELRCFLAADEELVEEITREREGRRTFYEELRKSARFST